MVVHSKNTFLALSAVMRAIGLVEIADFALAVGQVVFALNHWYASDEFQEGWILIEFELPIRENGVEFAVL